MISGSHFARRLKPCSESLALSRFACKKIGKHKLCLQTKDQVLL